MSDRLQYYTGLENLRQLTLPIENSELYPWVRPNLELQLVGGFLAMTPERWGTHLGGGF